MKKIILLFLLLIVVSPICHLNNLKAQNKIKKQSPLFIKNKGQWDSQVRYFTKIGGMNAWITDDGIVYDFFKIIKSNNENKILEKIPNCHRIGNIIKITFVNSKINHIQGINKYSGYNNYFIGNDKSKWVSFVPMFDELRFQELYEGISAKFYYDNNMLRYDFIAKPYSDISKIEINIEGSSGISVNNIGELVIKTNIGQVKEGKIYAYQIDGGNKQEVQCRFEMLDKNTVKLNVEDYNKSLPLVIDPITYSTFIGANNDDKAYGTTVDASNNVYISGHSYSPNFPTTTGAYDENQNGSWDVFVCKLNSSGSSLDYSTYIGGSSQDYGASIVIDGSNNTYITGHTFSSDFPTIATAYDTSNNGTADIFVCKLNSTGSSLDYSTYIGGSKQDYGKSIALDGSNNTYITGYTLSSDFPTSSTAYDKVQNGSQDVFVCKLNSSGSALDYSTYIGGKKIDEASSIAIDGANNTYITGYTFSSDFPTSDFAYDTSFNGYNGVDKDGFVCKLNSDFSSLIYSTFIGGSNNDLVYGIALDLSNNAYITGYTDSPNFPITANAFDTSQNGSFDIFVSKLNAAGSSLEYSTFIGGIGYDEAYSIALDPSNNAYITGFTNSSDFPISANAYDSSYSKNKDVFVCKINNTGSSLDYSTFLGDTNDDEAYNIAIDHLNNVYITGQTKSYDFPITSNAFDTSQNGQYDVFVTKLNLATISISSLSKSSFCVGEFINISFKITGNFVSNNKFIAQLSDEKGDFANPVILASLSGTNSGLFRNVKIPKTLSGGTKYRIRIVSTNPSVIGSNNGADLSIFTLPKPKIISGQNAVCSGNIYSYSSNEADGINYKWSVSSGTIIDADNARIVNIIWSSPGVGKLALTQTNINDCMDSAIMNISIYPLPQPVIVSGQDSVCAGNSYSYSSNEVYSIGYKWSVINGVIIGADDNQTVNIKWDSQDSGILTLTQIDDTACQDSVKMSILINPIPEVNYSSTITKVCINGPEFVLRGGTPEGGVYSGNGVIDGKFNPALANEGENSITYTFGKNGCENSASHIITVNPLPEKPTITEEEKTLSSSSAVSYQWYFNDVKITGAIEQSYKPTEEGYYKVEISNENGCKNISDEYYFNPTTVEDISKINTHISVIPNPVNRTTTIAYVVNKSAYVSITTTNSLGIEINKLVNNKLISKGFHRIEFDANKLSSGVYFCTIHTGQYTETVKMVIAR